eukprot:COSAG01_NODE_41504_length_450_cov_7.544160_1_plen_48_part_01
MFRIVSECKHGLLLRVLEHGHEFHRQFVFSARILSVKPQSSQCDVRRA